MTNRVATRVKLAYRVALRKYANYFGVGDAVLYGKWKNGRAYIKEFTVDKHGNPAVILQPVDREGKPSKPPKTLGLFSIWKAGIKKASELSRLCPWCQTSQELPDDTQDEMKCSSCGRWFQAVGDEEKLVRVDMV